MIPLLYRRLIREVLKEDWRDPQGLSCVCAHSSHGERVVNGVE